MGSLLLVNDAPMVLAVKENSFAGKLERLQPISLVHSMTKLLSKSLACGFLSTFFFEIFG